MNNVLDSYLQPLRVKKKKTKTFIKVEDALGFDENRLWYYIPGFNGYEVSNDGYIRSMKHFRKYPFGILLSPLRTKKGKLLQPLQYELSNNNNDRIIVTLEEIINLAANNPHYTTGYPRKTYVTDNASRNQRCTIKRQSPQPLNNICNYHFVIAQEEKQETQYMKNLFSHVTCPIESITGGTYYGRKN